jgi:hypothetical protein
MQALIGPQLISDNSDYRFFIKSHTLVMHGNENSELTRVSSCIYEREIDEVNRAVGLVRVLIILRISGYFTHALLVAE